MKPIKSLGCQMRFGCNIFSFTSTPCPLFFRVQLQALMCLCFCCLLCFRLCFCSCFCFSSCFCCYFLVCCRLRCFGFLLCFRICCQLSGSMSVCAFAFVSVSGAVLCLGFCFFSGFCFCSSYVSFALFGFCICCGFVLLFHQTLALGCLHCHGGPTKFRSRVSKELKQIMGCPRL